MPYIALQLVGLEAVLRTMGLNGTGIAGHLPLPVAFLILAVYTYQPGLRAPALIAFVKDILIYIVILVAEGRAPLTAPRSRRHAGYPSGTPQERRETRGASRGRAGRGSVGPITGLVNQQSPRKAVRAVGPPGRVVARSGARYPARCSDDSPTRSGGRPNTAQSDHSNAQRLHCSRLGCNIFRYNRDTQGDRRQPATTGGGGPGDRCRNGRQR